MREERPPRGFTVAFAIWAIIPLCLLALAAMNVTLVRGQETLTEVWAMSLVLLGQLLLLTALWRDLFLSLGSALLTTASSLPALALAGVLTGEGWRSTLWAWLAVLIWCGGLAAWRLAQPRGRHYLLSLLLLAWMLGGPALAYTHAEFGLAPGQRAFHPLPLASPLLAATSLREEPAEIFAWASLAAPLVVALPLLALRSWRWRRLSTAV